jgi:pyruvate dehydrogenase complex dehydrogenase (E1) component
MSPQGQHIELGMAESNLFLLLAALGLSIDTEAILDTAARACLVVMRPTG